MLYMVTFAINIPTMLAYIPYMDPMGMAYHAESSSPSTVAVQSAVDRSSKRPRQSRGPVVYPMPGGFHKWGYPEMDGLEWKIHENPIKTLLKWMIPCIDDL